MRFAVVNLGCKVNRVESDEAAAMLLSWGWEEAELSRSDLIVVNTCTVTGEADRKTRKAVNRALTSPRATRIVVTGCAATIDPDAYEALDPRVEVVPKARLLDRLAEIQGSYPQGEGARDIASGDPSNIASLSASAPSSASAPALSLERTALIRMGDGFNTRIGVKIQDGCAHACTYCIVHVARGVPWSKPAQDVIDEVRAYVRAGAREIVLTGINLGSYSCGSLGLAELLEELLGVLHEEDACVEAGQEARIRLSSIEPMDVDTRLTEVLADADGRICRHLHLPVQSGSTKVLREMDRPYSAEEYLALVARLRAAMPSIALSTDIIAGFPGETEEDFESSMRLCRAAGFMRMHVFPYSRREGTPAAQRADQIPHEVKVQRAAMLRRLGAELCADDLARRSETVERALVMPEGIAITESYHEFSLDEDLRAQVQPNRFIDYRFPDARNRVAGDSM